MQSCSHSLILLNIFDAWPELATMSQTVRKRDVLGRCACIYIKDYKGLIVPLGPVVHAFLRRKNAPKTLRCKHIQLRVDRLDTFRIDSAVVKFPTKKTIYSTYLPACLPACLLRKHMQKPSTDCKGLSRCNGKSLPLPAGRPFLLAVGSLLKSFCRSSSKTHPSQVGSILW